MKYLFKHIFYRVHCWNIYVIKEKDFPVLSAYFVVSALIGMNISTIIFVFLVFVFKDPQVYPTWGHWIIMILSITPSYFIFIHKKNTNL